MAVDVATRSIPAGIIAPTTKAVDAAAVLARMLVPEPMRPGWPESLHHVHSVIPPERLLSIDERFANAAARPVIIPETINCDRGKVYISETFLRACTSLGISVQPSRPYTGSDDTIVERTFGSMNTLFCQHLAGYAGRDTTRRGPDVAQEAIWTVAQLQELFDEWVVACWQSRPHEGLSHTWGEGRELSPNEMYTACVGISGYVPLPLTRGRLRRAPARRVRDRQRLRADHQQPDLRLQGPQPLPTAGLGPSGREQEEMGGPLRSLRHHRHLAAGPPRSQVDHRPVGLPLPGRAAVRPRPVGARPAHDHRTVGPRPAEADIARNVADLLNRARDQDLNPEEAKAVAVDANRPVRPPTEAPDDPATTPEPDEGGYEQVESAQSSEQGLRARARPQLPQGRPATAAAAAWAAARWCCIPDSTSCASARVSPALAVVRSSRATTATCSVAGGVPSWASMTI
jgi:hypothetical protein